MICSQRSLVSRTGTPCFEVILSDNGYLILSVRMIFHSGQLELLPRVHHKEMDHLTKDEIHLFLKHVPEEYHSLFLTGILTGLRRGELLSMKWSNLDWNKKQ